MSDEVPKLKEDKFYEFRPFRVPKYQIKFERASKLSDIPGYVWYSPAAIYVWGRYSEINLSDLVREHDAKIFWYKFDKPIFKGFEVNGDPSWNHLLWAAPEEQWKKIYETVLETVQFDIPNRRLYQYALQKFMIYDPLSMDKNRVALPVTPQIEVQAFAVLSNIRQYAFDTRKADTRAQPGMVLFRPAQLHVDAANQLFSNKRLTQDTAFEEYRRIILAAQDAAFETQWKNKVARWKTTE